MIKKYLKRGLSLLLALVLVATTFFIFDPDLLRVESDAYVDVAPAEAGAFLSSQSFYATETIYLQTGTNAFQYYENFSYSTGSVSSPVDTSGSVYFKNDDVTEVALYVNNVYKRDTKAQVGVGNLVINSTTVSEYAGMANGAATRSKGTQITKVTGTTLNYPITSGSLSGWVEGGVYIIEWVVAYKTKHTGDAEHYSFAYTGIYAAPDDQAGITLAARHQNDDATSHQYGFITGGHKVSGGNAYSVITDTSGNVKRNPLLGFVGQMDSTDYTITGGSNLYKVNSAYFPEKVGGGVAAQTFDETSCGGADTGWGTVEVSTTHYTQSSDGAISVGTYDAPNAQGKLRRQFSDNHTTIENHSTGVTYLLVDTSRYSNYNQIPNFKVGWVQFYTQSGGRQNNLESIYVSNETGNTRLSNYSVNYDSANIANQGEQSATKGLFSISGPVTAGLKFANIDSRITRDRNVSDHRLFLYSNIGFHTTTWDQSTLRMQYNKALCSYVDYKNVQTYASGQAANFVVSYYENVKAVGEELADPTAHSIQAKPELSTYVDNCSKAIRDGSAPEIYFWVPEVAYINPIASNGTYALQYFVDRQQADNGELTKDATKTSGNIYFSAKTAASVKSLTYRQMSEYGANTTTLSIGQTTSSSGKLSTTFTGNVASYSLSYIEWTLTYVTATGQELKAMAYTCCYPSLISASNHNGVISATSSTRRKSGSLALTTTGWIVGAHSVDSNAYIISSTTSGTATNTETGVDWDHYGAYVSNYLADRATGGPTAGSEDDNSFGALYNTSKIGGSGYWASNSSPTYSTGGKGTLIVDSSRYSNLNQIPNLYAGVDANNTDRNNSPNEHAMTMYLYSKWYGGSDTELATKTNLAENWGGNLPADREVRKIYAPFEGGITGVRTAIVSAKGYFRRSGDDRTGYSSCYLVCTFVNKAPARDAYENAIKKSQYLQEEYFTTAAWAAYEGAMIDCAGYLINPAASTSQADFNNKAAALNGEVNKLVGAITATSETYSYVNSAGTSVTAKRSDVLKKGTATVYHVIVDLDEDGKITGTRDIGSKETKAFYFGDTVVSGYNNYDGYNYFGYYLSESGTKWTQSLGTSVLKGDMAAQGSYGLSGHNRYILAKSANLTYTYVYSENPSGVYMDYGVAETAFLNKENLADLTDVDIDTAYEGDSTLYGSVDTRTTTSDNVTYTSGAAIVSKKGKDGFDFSIQNVGYNTYTSTSKGLKNLFNFDTYGWNASRCTVTIDKNRDSLRMVTSDSDAYAGNYNGSSATYMTLTPGRTYVLSYNWHNNLNEDEFKLLPYIFYSASNNPFSYSVAPGTLKSYPETVEGKNGTHMIEFTVPTGAPYVSIRLGIDSGAGYDVTFSDINVLDTTDSSQFGKMNDIFFPEVAKGLTGGKTYTVSFKSSLRYDDYRWYAINMYGGATPEMDWAHEQGTIQTFISTTSTGADGELTNYTVPVRVTTDISTGGTIGTFDLPEGCSVINLGFCFTNDTPLAGWVDDIRIVEGDYVEIGYNGETYTVPDPVWEGYTFTGWEEKSAPFNGELSGDLNRNYTYGTGSDTILANWTINQYDITFDNEFDFDKGWTSPSEKNGTIAVNTDENKFTLTTLSNASSADNTVVSNCIVDLVPGHRYRLSYKYNVNNYVSGGGMQNHIFLYSNETDAKNNNFGPVGFIGQNANLPFIQGSVYPTVNGTDKKTGTIMLEFVAPANAEFARLRLGNTNQNGMEIEFSDIYWQDISRGSGENVVHDTTVSEPHLTVEGATTVYHNFVRNYKATIKNDYITELPIITSERYDFEGWYTGKNGTGTKVTVNDITEPRTNQKWSNWTVHLDYLLDSECKFKGEGANKFLAPESSYGLNIGESVKIVDYVPYKVGYNFNGWLNNCDGQVYWPGETMVLYQNANLSPVWEKATEIQKNTEDDAPYQQLTKLYPGQVYFYAYKPVSNNEYISGYVYDTTETMSLTLYKPDGTSVDATTERTYGMSGVDGLVSSELEKGKEYYYGITIVDDKPTTEANPPVDVSASFKIREHIVNYILNPAEGTSSVTSAVGHYGTDTALPLPARPGHDFAGWKIEGILNKTYTADNLKIPAADSNTLILSNTASFVTTETLLALWDIKNYNLNAYAYNNAATSPTTVSTEYSLSSGEVGGTVSIRYEDSENVGYSLTQPVEYRKSATFWATPKTGYNFIGWYTNPIVESGKVTDWGSDVPNYSEQSVTIAAMEAADLSVYARFDIKTYRVNLIANTNSSEATDTYIPSTTGGTVKLDAGVSVKDYVYGQKFTMIAEAADGYEFKGWFYNDHDLTGTTPYTAPETEIEVTDNLDVNGIITFNAAFSVKQYNLHLDKDGGELVQDKFMGFTGQKVQVTPPTKVGYTFVGWTVEDFAIPGGAAHGYFNGNEYTFGPGDDKATAIWEINSYPITINPDNGVVTISYRADGELDFRTQTFADSRTIEMDYNTVLTLNLPQKTGFTFERWDVTGNKNAFQSGTGGNSSTYTIALDDAAVFTALWTVNQYNLTAKVYGDALDSEGIYNENLGGTVKIGEDGTPAKEQSVNIDYGTPATLIAIPDEGYSFVGWSSIIPSVNNINIVSEDTTFVTPDMPAKPVQYYAVFSINQYEITLDAEYDTAVNPGVFKPGTDGGTATGEGTYTYGAAVTLKATPETGYSFAGWYDGDTIVSAHASFEYTVTEAKNLTARFKISEYIVTTWVRANTAAQPDEYLQNDVAGKITGQKTYYYGQTTNITATAASGYVFVGWYSDAELKHTVGDGSATLAEPVYNHVNYYAKFDVIMVDINLYAMSNTGDDISKYTESSMGGGVAFVNEGYNVTNATSKAFGSQITICAKPAAGYEFKGWYTSEEMDEDSLLDGSQRFADGHYELNVPVDTAKGEKFWAKFTVSSYDLNVYAYSNEGIAPDLYKLSYTGGKISIKESAAINGEINTFDSNGARAMAKVYLNKSVILEAETALGYTFSGWYTQESGGTLSNLVGSELEYVTAAMVTEGLNYYAKFDVGKFTITYDPNGASNEGKVTQETLYYGKSHNISSEANPNDYVGHEFLGWSTSPDATVAEFAPSGFIEETVVNPWYLAGGNVTLYAVWARRANTIYAKSAYSRANGIYYMDYDGSEGGTVEVVPLNPDTDLDENGNVVVPLGGLVQDYLRFTPKAGFAFVRWQYSTLASDVPADGARVSAEWCSDGTNLQITMPAQPIYVIGFFEIQRFNASAFAYYNTAANPDQYVAGATGGTVKKGKTGVNASTAISEDVNFGAEVLFIASAARGYTFSGWYKTPTFDENGVASNWGEPVVTGTDNYVSVVDSTQPGMENANDYYAVFSIKSFKATASVKTYSVSEDRIYSLGENQWPGGSPSNVGGNVGLGLTSTADTTWLWTETYENERSITGIYYGQRVYFEAEANTGYMFGGWYNVRNAEYYGENLVEDMLLNYSSIMREGDMYIEAKFVPVTFTLVLDPNGGTAGNPEEIVVTYNEPFKIVDESIPTNTGSTFMGWSDSASGSVVEGYNSTIYPETISEWYKKLDADSRYTIYAIWEEAVIHVTFDKQGADGTLEKVEISVGAKLPDLEEVPTYDGFVFGGYFTEPGGNGTPFYTADGKATEQRWNNTANGTIYALWTCPVLIDIAYDEQTQKWNYKYQDEAGGETVVTTEDPLTSATDVTEKVKSEENLMWWTLKVDTPDTSFVEEQIKETPKLNLNHYSDAALVNLLKAVNETDTEKELTALTQPKANSYVAEMAKNMELGFAANRNTADTAIPTLKLYETAEKVDLIKRETLDAETSANGSAYGVPASADAANYAFAKKWSYTLNGGKGGAVDYYLYTNSPNPVIALEIGDGAVAENVVDNTSSYPTKATVVDNAANFGYVTGKSMVSAIPATDDIEKAWFSKYTSAGIGTEYDYNAKTVVYLTPEFSSSGIKNEIVYTIKASDDAVTPNEGIGKAELGNSTADLRTYQSYQYDKVGTTGTEDITICICYHNAMNGESDEGTLDASGTYMQMSMDQVNVDTYLNQLHLFRTSGGASNDHFPTTSESIYPIYDETYPYTDPRIAGTMGSFAYVFDATLEPDAVALAEQGDYTGAKLEIIESVSGNAQEFRASFNNKDHPLHITKGGTGTFAITGWSNNFYPKTGTYVYAHLVDRWGNVFNRVWKCFNVDSYPSKINATDVAVYDVFEDGGSNIGNVVLSGAEVEFLLDDNSTYENGVFSTTGNSVVLSTGEPNKTYSLTVTDKATNETKVNVTTNDEGILVLNVEDTKPNLSSGAYTFTLNGETVNLYAGVDKLVLDADITTVSMAGSETIVTVKTTESVLKLQLVEGIATRTYSRSTSDVVKNDDGTYTWTIRFKASLGEHTYNVKAKTSKGWSDTDYALSTQIIKSNGTSKVALKHVYDDSVEIGEKAIVKVNVLEGTQKVQLVYSNGGTTTYDRSADRVVAAENGVETWALPAKAFSTAGEYEIKVIAKYDGEWQSTTARTSIVTVKEEVKSTAPVIYSVEAESSSVKSGEYVTFTLLTNANAAKVRFNYPASTATFSETNATVVNNSDGTKTWTIKVKLSTLGENDINFSAKSVSGWGEGTSFGTITVTK